MPQEADMSINDYYYQTVSKQRVAELHARAAEDRLARLARQARKEQRAARRAERRLQVAVDGPRGLRHALRTLFVPEQTGSDHPVPEHQVEETTVDDTSSAVR
jgi:hypothetical protein